MFLNKEQIRKELNGLFEKAHLNDLVDWCKKNISQDRVPAENEDEYAFYTLLATDYVEQFLPLINENNLISSMLIERATEAAYDRFLSQQPITAELINIPNSNQMTALHRAAALGYVHTTMALLAKGANPLVMNKQKQTPLFFALLLPCLFDYELVEKKEHIFNLLTEKEPILWSLEDEGGDTLLHQIAAQGFINLANLVIEKHPHLVEEQNKKNSLFPIHTAILNNNTEVVAALLAIPGVAHLSDKNGRTALHYAACYADESIVELCIAAVQDLNVPANEGETPLILAVQANNKDALVCLLDHNVDIMAVDAQQHSALNYAIDNEELLELLRTKQKGMYC